MFPGISDLSIVKLDVQHLLRRRVNLANLLLPETQKTSRKEREMSTSYNPNVTS